MAKIHFLTRPTPLSQLNSEDLEELFSDDWREKAERLQRRRWRKLKHAAL